MLETLLTDSLAQTFQAAATNKQSETPNGETDFLVVNQIHTEGNKRTRKYVILREMDIAEGDTLSMEQVQEVFKRNENQVYNTQLFNNVSIKINALQNNVAELTVAVEERWYILPAPIFELTDDFNVWWKVHNRDLSRTEYGMLFTHVNFRGRKELLKLNVQLGYTKKLELSYHLPFIDKERKTGITPSISYIINRQLAYKTQQNKHLIFRDSTYTRQDLFNDSTYIRKRFRTGLAITRRPDIRWRHYFNLSYFNNSISPSVNELSQGNYFLDHRIKQQYFYFAYVLSYDNRDIHAYPLKGNLFSVQFSKAGLGIFNDLNMMWINANYTQYVPLGHRFFAVANVQGRVSFPEVQPYFNQGGLSGGNTIRGYQLYIIDGQHIGMLRTALRYQLLKKKFTNPILKADQFKTIPLSIYLKGFAELGYVQDNYYTEGNFLANTLLKGTGFGIDINTAYDTVFGLEYARNHLGEWGFFVGFSVNY